MKLMEHGKRGLDSETPAPLVSYTLEDKDNLQ